MVLPAEMHMYSLSAHAFRMNTAAVLCFLFLPSASFAVNQQEWRFSVYLDDMQIGHHHFVLTKTGMEEKLATRAEFDVTFMMIPFYRYRHENTEYWKDNCLKRIASTTDQNGTTYQVEGMSTGDGFRIRTNSGEQVLPACISTFAYWDKSFLQRERLLNVQTGELLDIDVNYLGEDPLVAGKTSIPAHRYRLTASGLEIEIWYSQDDQWLALQSTTSDGRLLRYTAE
jgi:hypothetical protein